MEDDDLDLEEPLDGELDDEDASDELLLMDELVDEELAGSTEQADAAALAQLRTALNDHVGDPPPAALGEEEDDLLDRLAAVMASDPDPSAVPRRMHWLGAVVELVRTGTGAAAEAPDWLEAIESCPEVEGDLDPADAGRLEDAFEAAVEGFTDAGVVDDDGRLTEIGAWLLPRALARAWNGDFDEA